MSPLRAVSCSIGRLPIGAAIQFGPRSVKGRLYRNDRCWHKAGLRCKQSRTRHESHDGEKFSSPLNQKKKAGGHYAADLVLQLPARGSGSVALHSVLLDRFDW
jgi:hypothetical protein